MDNFEEITLIDPEVNKSYKLRPSAEDAEKTRHNMNFALALVCYAQSFPHKKAAGVAPAANNVIHEIQFSKAVPTTPRILHNEVIAETCCSTAQARPVMSTIVANIDLDAIPIGTHLERNEKKMTSGTLNLAENGERENDGIYNWSRAESLLLIRLYKMNKDMFTSGKATQKHCWDRISRLFAEKGCAIPGRKCCTKFQALKRTYKNIKDHNNKSGNSNKTWDYYR